MAPHLTPRCLRPAAAHLSIHSISDQSLLDALEFSQGTFEFKWLARIPSGQPPPPFRYALHSAPALPFISHHVFSRPLRGRTIFPLSIRRPAPAPVSTRFRAREGLVEFADVLIQPSTDTPLALSISDGAGAFSQSLPVTVEYSKSACLFSNPKSALSPSSSPFPTPLTLPTPLTPVTP